MGNYHFLFAFGSTPTRVGNITHLMPESPAAKAFPPPTWGIPLVFVFNNLLSGLPPPAWGTLLQEEKTLRSTPTRAGNTAIFLCFPRLHGGLPPLAWGKVQVIQTASDTPGNTPTRVGKSASCLDRKRYREEYPHVHEESVSESESLPRIQEHPHLRGEYHAWYDVNDDVPGAPPPAWGTSWC